MDIHELPDFFALEHLARSLWRNGESRGAGLFVGSGFSRFAELPGPSSPKPPLWATLRSKMAAQIYSGVPDKDVPTDPLRLAEEYCALLGQAALDDFIRMEIPDHAWNPGPVHQRIMQLPWSDVLTTNWDTLLERTAQSVAEIGYEVVSVVGDIARAKSPRIVKLHGTIPSGPFIFTEEDYRTYPVRYAPFVNLARQVFLESELCLVGFSGTDPNFLQWSGWVRDHLGASTRRIYLVGVLNLRPAARRLLEARNVAPIDLAPLVATLDPEKQHAKAIDLFLDFLAKAEPAPAHAWSPADQSGLPPSSSPDEFVRRHKDKKYAASLLDAAAHTWQSEREKYPGWVACPRAKRGPLRYATDSVPMPSSEILANLTVERGARILYELIWRFDTSFWPIPDELRALVQDAVVSSPRSGLTLSERLYAAVVLLRATRENNDASNFNILAKLIEEQSDGDADILAEVAYQKCLWSRDKLDFVSLSKELQQLGGLDPVWGLRRAGLYCELGEFAKAESLVTASLNELRQRQQRDRRSLWILSRRAWAQFLDRAADTGMSLGVSVKRAGTTRGRDWPLEFKETKSDPWDELDSVEDEVDIAHRERNKNSFDPKIHFDAGTYTESGTGLKFQSSSVVSPAYALDRLSEAVGIALAFGYATILTNASKRLSSLTSSPPSPGIRGCCGYCGTTRMNSSSATSAA
jgi:hypothetical protein